MTVPADMKNTHRDNARPLHAGSTRTHVDTVRLLCRQRGIRIVSRGSLVHCTGPGVDISAVGLHAVQVGDLEPVFSRSLDL